MLVARTSTAESIRIVRGVLLSAVCFSFTAGMLSAAEPASKHAFSFRDIAEAAGLLPEIAGIQGHAAGWGDVDGDGLFDLYVATFHKTGAKSNRFFRNLGGGKFKLDEQEQLQISTRATGALFVDLDNDGDLDFYVSSMPQKKTGMLGNTLFRNDGSGKFTNISQGNGACPIEFGGRSATALDYDGDGLLDLLVGEDPVPGYNGSKTKSTRLFHNLGELKFADASREVGLLEGIPGLGVAAADVNNDGWPDFFIASSMGNMLFLNDGKGKFQEAAGTRDTFVWPKAGGDNMVCGVSFADVNRDGWLDMVLGPHFSSQWIEPIPVRLYLNRTKNAGKVSFEDVTTKVGLTPLPMKAPHVEIQDFDNDGWPDISTSMVKLAGGKTYPVIFKHLGLKDGLPQFREDVLGVNDFPTAEDIGIKRTGTFFQKMIDEKKVIYMAPGPTADFDNDGRLDFFLPNWWEESPSLLLRNETEGGNWLQLEVQGNSGVNRSGIGARILVYEAGKLGNSTALIGCRDVASGFGYASAQPAVTHFGLGDAPRVDIEVILPHGKGKIQKTGVAANQRLTIRQAE